MRKFDREDKLLAGTLFAFFAGGAGSQALGSLIPFFRETYGLNYDFAGMMVSLQSVGNLAAIMLMGYLPVFLGRRKSVLLTAAWMAAAYLIFATGLGGAAALLPACLMIGIAKGGNANFANTMMSTLPGRKASVGYHLAHGACAVGSLLAPMLVVACASGSVSRWRTAAVVLLGLCALQLVDYLLMPMPQEKWEKSVRSIDRSFLRSRSFWLASAIMFFYASTEYAINGWLVTYFQDIGVLSDNVAQMMSSLFWLVMFIGRMIGAWFVGRISRKHLLVVDGTGLLVSFLLVIFSRSEIPIFIGITGVGLFMATIYTSALALGTASIRGNDLGVSSMILAGSFGGIVTPAAVGFVAEQAGIRIGMYVVAGTIVLLLATILIAVFSRENSSVDSE